MGDDANLPHLVVVLATDPRPTTVWLSGAGLEPYAPTINLQDTKRNSLVSGAGFEPLRLHREIYGIWTRGVLDNVRGTHGSGRHLAGRPSPAIKPRGNIGGGSGGA